jgi:hypothetical protein
MGMDYDSATGSGSRRVMFAHQVSEPVLPTDCHGHIGAPSTVPVGNQVALSTDQLADKVLREALDLRSPSSIV